MLLLLRFIQCKILYNVLVLPKFDVQVSVPGFNFVQDDFVTVRVSAA